MIEAMVPWTLEGPDDSITFNDGGVWHLVEKPRTSVDDRRESYDYPLDDGGFVGDAYAGMRAWSLKGMLTASSHAERNAELQRLNALLNSLRRADGLLKWQPSGFPAVQASVRRMGSVDYSGGANLHVPVTFGLLSGDPRVYSQAENTETAAAGVGTYGANMLDANTSSMETSDAGWTPGLYSSISRSTTYAYAGAASLRLATTLASRQEMSAIIATPIAVSPGDTLRISARGRPMVSGVLVYVFCSWRDASNAEITIAYQTAPAPTGSFTEVARDFTAPSGAASLVLSVGFNKSSGGGFALGTDYAYFDDVRVEPGAYSAAVSVVNAGDALSQPKYLVTGPAGTPEITNLTRSEAMILNTSVTAAQVLTVDAAAREIYVGASVESGNAYASKDSSDPFPLLSVGSNSFTFEASGADANTELEVRWRDAWMP